MHPFEQQPTVFGIIAVTCAVFLWQAAQGPQGLHEYSLVPAQTEDAIYSLLQGEITASVVHALSTTVTALFLHGSVEHLLMNMVFLWMFGSLVSRHLGKAWALGLFFLCGIGGFVAHVLLNRGSTIPCIGASGAVSGFEGVYLGLALRWQLGLADVWPLARPIPPSQLVLYAGVGVGLDFWGMAQADMAIAYGAHIGGFVTGLTVSTLITQFYWSENRWKHQR